MLLPIKHSIFHHKRNNNIKYIDKILQNNKGRLKNFKAIELNYYFITLHTQWNHKIRVNIVILKKCYVSRCMRFVV